MCGEYCVELRVGVLRCGLVGSRDIVEVEKKKKAENGSISISARSLKAGKGNLKISNLIL